MRVENSLAGGGKRRHAADPAWVRRTLILSAFAVIGVLIVVPVANVFVNAFGDGIAGYWRHVAGDKDTRHAILLTLFVAPTAVALNAVFGTAAAWAIAKFRFPGRSALLAVIDLPFAVSPVVAGLMLVLLFGAKGYFGPELRDLGIKVVFSWPGLILATTFVTLPFIARELIPVMEALGPEEEIAAISLGANGWQTFRMVTLPNIKWALVYGVILCNARAMGEFGAVYVVSGHIAGKTDTLPLRIEKLFVEYESTASFAAASLLTVLALVTLAAKTVLERWTRADLAERAVA
jgi:sulfate transport system permease protein